MADGTAAAEAKIEQVIDNAVEAVAVNPQVPGVTADNASAVATAIKNEVTPVLMNAANAEPLVQSRVLWGATIASLAPLVLLLLQLLRSLGVEIPDISEARIIEIGTALVTLIGTAVVFYGRLKVGLKPPFWRPKT